MAPRWCEAAGSSDLISDDGTQAHGATAKSDQNRQMIGGQAAWHD